MKPGKDEARRRYHFAAFIDVDVVARSFAGDLVFVKKGTLAERTRDSFQARVCRWVLGNALEHCVDANCGVRVCRVSYE